MNYISEQFVEANSTKYTLSIRLQADGFSFMVRINGLLLVLKENKFHVEGNTIQDLLLQESILHLPYKQSVLFVENRDKIIVPEEFFSSETIATIYALSAPLSPNTTLVYNHLPEMYNYVVQEWESNLVEFVNEHFPSMNIVNALYGVLMEYTLSRNAEEHVLHVDIYATHFNLIVTNGKQLLFYNVFNYSSPIDIVYHILNTMQQSSIREITTCNISGMLSKEIALLERYIPNVTYKGCEELMRLCNLTNMQQSQYVNHLIMHECEL